MWNNYLLIFILNKYNIGKCKYKQYMGGFPEKPGSENNKLFLKKIDQKFVTRHLIILNPKNLLLFLELFKNKSW